MEAVCSQGYQSAGVWAEPYAHTTFLFHAGFFVCKLKKLSNTKREVDAKEDAEMDAEERAAAASTDGMQFCSDHLLFFAAGHQLSVRT